MVFVSFVAKKKLGGQLPPTPPVTKCLFLWGEYKNPLGVE